MTQVIRNHAAQTRTMRGLLEDAADSVSSQRLRFGSHVSSVWIRNQFPEPPPASAFTERCRTQRNTPDSRNGPTCVVEPIATPRSAIPADATLLHEALCLE